MTWTNGASRTSTSEHKTWRRAVLQRDGHQCQLREPGCTGVATQADHKIPVAWGGNETLDNGQGACESCHQRKTKREAAEGRRRAAAQRPRSKREPERHPGLQET